MNYRDFSVQDFVWDDKFRDWVLDPTPELNLFWADWLVANPNRADDINAAREVVSAVQINENTISDFEIDLAISGVMQKIDRQEASTSIEIPQREEKQKSLFHFKIKRSLVFSIVAVLFLSIGVLFYQSETVQGNAGVLIEQVNNGASPLKFNLPDGSIITLEKNAKISYSESFEGLSNRKVYLSGEAFFEVERDPAKPFIVYSNGLITKVLGTKFRIRSFPGEKNSFVEVTSGIVAVYSLTDKDSEDELHGEKLNNIILTRNQKATYSNDDRTVMAALVENPVATNNALFNYTFSETPIKNIFNNIEEGYGIEIIYDEKLLAQRTLTADLTLTTLFEKLDIICKVLNTHYEIIDGKVIIYSN